MKMKILKNTCSSLSILFLFGLLLSCGVSTQKVTVPAADAEQAENPRGFNPMELPMDNTIIPREYPRSMDLVGNSIIAASSDEDTIVAPIENSPEEIDTLNSQAYRIQLFSTKVYGEARNELQVAEEIFDRPLFMDYEVPYYKIRVGNFADRDKAEKYQQRARAAGYQNAWVVMVTVNIQEAQPLYNDNDLFLPPNDSLDSAVDSLKDMETDDNLE